MNALSEQLLDGLQIISWSEDMEDPDPWVTLDQLEKVFSEREIRTDRNKEPSLLVLDGDEVVGGSYHSVTEGGNCFSFDICVLPAYERRGIATKLIQMELAEARHMECERVWVWAVNPWMAKTLEDKFGFSVTQNLGGGAATLELYL